MGKSGKIEDAIIAGTDTGQDGLLLSILKLPGRNLHAYLDAHNFYELRAFLRDEFSRSATRETVKPPSALRDWSATGLALVMTAMGVAEQRKTSSTIKVRLPKLKIDF